MISGVFTIPLVSMDGSATVSTSNSVVPSATYHQFIAGPENTLLRVLLAAIETSHRPFNPITLYGPTGVGKSHLLHGLVERHKTWSADSRTTFLTGADFARAFASAIELDSVADWREKHFSVDLLVLDDVQELATKPAAQQELVHTIDTLIDQEHQMVIASRHAPLDWNWMLPTLRSRLEGGLLIPVAVPAFETQQYMANEIAAHHGLTANVDFVLPASPSPLTYPQIRSSIWQSMQQRDVLTTEHAENDSPRERGSLPKIAKLVARHSHVKLSDMLGPSRRQTVVRARGVAFYLARSLLRLSFQDIGAYFGGRDHTTVLHSWRKTIERLETDARLKHEVNKLLALCADNFEVQRP